MAGNSTTIVFSDKERARKEALGVTWPEIMRLGLDTAERVAGENNAVAGKPEQTA